MTNKQLLTLVNKLNKGLLESKTVCNVEFRNDNSKELSISITFFKDVALSDNFTIFIYDFTDKKVGDSIVDDCLELMKNPNKFQKIREEHIAK